MAFPEKSECREGLQIVVEGTWVALVRPHSIEGIILETPMSLIDITEEALKKALGIGAKNNTRGR